MSNASDFGYGQMSPEDVGSETSTILFLARQLIQRLNTMKLVQVKAVHAGSGMPPAPATVDVQPLVSQIDANGYATAHGTVYGLPCWRLQAGPRAIIADPAVGDVGYVVCADRDISNVVRNAGMISGPYNPGSRRQYDLADGVYVGGCLNAAPTQYLWLKPDGTLVIVDGMGNQLQTSSSGFSLTGNVAVTGNITATGTIIGGYETPDQVGLTTHEHAANDTPPTPGT
jgi:hypothetical protein